MAKVKSKKLSWDPSPDLDVAGYVVCWSDQPEAIGSGSRESDYDISTKIDVGNVTTVNLPLPGMPKDFDGIMYIGVWAYDDAGNFSDITRTSVPLDFIAPAAPSNLRVE